MAAAQFEVWLSKADVIVLGSQVVAEVQDRRSNGLLAASL